MKGHMIFRYKKQRSYANAISTPLRTFNAFASRVVERLSVRSAGTQGSRPAGHPPRRRLHSRCLLRPSIVHDDA